MNWPWLPWAQKSLGGPVPGWVHQQYWNLGEGSVLVSTRAEAATQARGTSCRPRQAPWWR